MDKDAATLAMSSLQSRGYELAIENLAIRNGLREIPQLPVKVQAPLDEPDIECEAFSSRMVRMHERTVFYP